MRAKEMADAYEMRLEIFEAAGWICEHCGKPLPAGQPQLGHRIPQNKMNLARYGKSVIHHRDNLAPVCCLKCNAAVSIGGRPLEIEVLAASIRAKL